MLEIQGLLKFAEVYDYKEGCDPDTTTSVFLDITFRATTQEDIINEVCNFLGIDNKKENYLLNSCDEVGRVDFQTMEDGEGNNAT